MNMKLMQSLLVAASMVIGASGSALAADMPKAGDTAPLFSGTDQNGNAFNLSDYVGKKVVLLYFYPKDFTGGCTKEACGFRDRVSDLASNNVMVVGVSYDTVESHKAFIAKYNLNFTLLADPDGKIVDLYGTKMATIKLSSRVSFLIGLDGKIVHVTNAGNPQKHFDEMSAAIASLPGQKT